MVSDSTADLVREIATTNLEFNAKIFIFLILLAYFLFSFWLSYRVLPSNSSFNSVKLSELIFAGWLRILSTIFLFFYPLYTTVFLFSGVALELIMRYMFYAYGIFGILIGIFGMVFGFEKLLEFLGLSLFQQRGKMRKGRPNKR